MDDEQPVPVPLSKEEYKIVESYTEKVRIVIQTCNDAEYYAVLDLFEPPRIENAKYEKPVQYFHKEIRIVVGTFAGIDAAIVETDQGTECKEGLQAAVEVFKSAKFLLGLGICYGIKDNSVGEDLKFADVLVSEGIGVSKRPKLKPAGLDPRASFEKVEKVMKNIFCVRPMERYSGIVVSDEPKQRTAKVYVGRLLSASILMNDGGKLGLIKEGYLGGEMEGWVQLEIPEVVSIVIKGIADFADGKKNDKWQLTAAKAAVHYAHHKLKQFGYIDFDKL